VSWYLQKTWVDQEEGIDGVIIHYWCSALDRPPDFTAHHESRVLHDWGGGRRAKVLKLPRQIWDEEWGWSVEYAFHHQFEVVQGENRWSTAVVSEAITSKELEYVDNTGFITNICVHWAVNDWTAPAYSPMEDERFPDDSEFSSLRYYGYQNKGQFHYAKAAMLNQLSLPHRWLGRIWGPRGSTVLQQYHIGHMYPEHEQTEFFLGPDGPTHEFGSSWGHLM
jgi:hypothetical protein